MRKLPSSAPCWKKSSSKTRVRRPLLAATRSHVQLPARRLTAAWCVTGKSVEGSEPKKSLDAAQDAAWKGQEVNLGMADLLRARSGADRAIECVSAAGQHLNLVCHVSEFVREARAAMSAQCDEILQDALQQEVTLLQQDRCALASCSCAQAAMQAVKQAVAQAVSAGSQCRQSCRQSKG